MKYIITEQQYKNLLEQEVPNWFKRRFNVETIGIYIDEIHDYNSDLNICNEYMSPNDYTESVIYQAVSKFMTTDEDIMENEKYDEWEELLTELCMIHYEDELFDIYRETCSEENY
jgi:hypothetical protein